MGGVAKYFEAHVVDCRAFNLEPVYSGERKPLSPYERVNYPPHGYTSIIHNPFRDRLLIYLESFDPKYTEELG